MPPSTHYTLHTTHSVLARRIPRRAPNVNTRASLCSILSRSYVPLASVCVKQCLSGPLQSYMSQPPSGSEPPRSNDGHRQKGAPRIQAAAAPCQPGPAARTLAADKGRSTKLTAAAAPAAAPAPRRRSRGAPSRPVPTCKIGNGELCAPGSAAS